MKRSLALAGLVLFLFACSKSYEDQVSELVSYMSGHRIGSSSDVWLVKGNLGLTDRVALIFGYASDMDFCTEIATLYTKKYPGDVYTCIFAN